jgi:hypothetical protein
VQVRGSGQRWFRLRHTSGSDRKWRSEACPLSRYRRRSSMLARIVAKSSQHAIVIESP